jgi:hypothetical protein
MLAANDVGDRSAWASKVVEQLAFDGMTAEQACAAFLSATGDWFDRYSSKDPNADFARMWAKFGLPHVEARKAGSELTAAFIERNSEKYSLAAANDNVPATHAGSVSTPPAPPMHPDPFAPASAGGLLAEIATWITSTAIIPVAELGRAPPYHLHRPDLVRPCHECDYRLGHVSCSD